MVALIVTTGLSSIGCVSKCSTRPGVEARYNNLVDPCWPERYSYQARENVLNPFELQANNAQILNHTLWNYHFERGTAKLTAHGYQKLDSIAQQRGHADGKLYLQTARDLIYDPKAPEKLPAERSQLDQDRAQAILAYMNAQPAGRNLAYDVQPIDAADPSINSAGPATSVRGLPGQYASTLTGAVGGNLVGTGGGAAPGTPSQAPAQGGAAPAGPTTR
jgi:hypothetical protein